MSRSCIAIGEFPPEVNGNVPAGPRRRLRYAGPGELLSTWAYRVAADHRLNFETCCHHSPQVGLADGGSELGFSSGRDDSGAAEYAQPGSESERARICADVRLFED